MLGQLGMAQSCESSEYRVRVLSINAGMQLDICEAKGGWICRESAD